MQSSHELKEMVRNKYAEIARQDKATNQSSCCGAGSCSTDVYNIMNEDYQDMEGYEPVADLGLGCGLPTQFAQIRSGDVVIDLGSGAGNDAFIARHQTGESGKVIGIDFARPMIEKAQQNASLRGYRNVEFREGDIEHLPVGDHTADVIVSNCVLNLVPNKAGVFSEIYRVLKPGGHFSISDIVLEGDLPAEIQQAAEMYAGCVSGAIQKNAYLHLISAAKFSNISVQKEKVITLPEDILKKYLTPKQLQSFNTSNSGIYSITVYAEKPTSPCCTSNCCQ